ncbi:MAG: glycosyltransferase family 39 protein [Dehalococcoidia bacterium]|nr:glycosyltransferase family 39 protein [Dehalococcoidia bacterium]
MAERIYRRRSRGAPGAVALVLRIVQLDQLPAGLHGDEAIVGLEAERILREGWIGVYSPLAAGQPAGPIYAWAPAVAAFGNSIMAVRLVAALAGAASVVVTFLLLRRDFGLLAAFVSAAILAAVAWHLHYSRIAFPLAFWPLLIVVMQWAVVRAFASADRRWWIAAGAVTALGVYVYNAHWIAGAAVAAAGIVFLAMRGRGLLRRDLWNVAAAAGGAALVLLPMLHLLITARGYYSAHFQRDSYLGSAEWQAHGGALDHAAALAGRYVDVWQFLLGWGGRDNVDAAGVVAMLPLPLLLLAAWGALAGRRYPALRWWWLVSLALVIVMPLASVLSLEGLPRRTFAMVVPLAILAGLAAFDVRARLHSTGRFPALRRGLAPAAAVLAFGICVPGVITYYSAFPDHPYQRWVFAENFTHASLYMEDLDHRHAILVASDRHSVDYETRKFLAPELGAADWQHPDQGPPPTATPTLLVLIGDEQRHISDALEAGARSVVGPEETGYRFAVLCHGCTPSMVEDLREQHRP